MGSVDGSRQQDSPPARELRFEKAIGRVGALAVVLGVGVGLGTPLGCGIAYANGPDSPSSSPDESGGRTSAGTDSGGRSRGTGTRTPVRAPRDSAVTDPVTSSRGRTSVRDDTLDAGPVTDTGSAVNGDQGPTGSAQPGSAAARGAALPGSGESNDAPPVPLAGNAAPPAVSTQPQTSRPLSLDAPPTNASLQTVATAGVGALPAAASSAAPVVSLTGPGQGLPALRAAAGAAPITLRTIITDTLTWFGLGGLAPRLPIPDLPVSAFIGGLWLSVREVQRTLNNQRPTAQPTLSGQGPDGTIRGRLNAIDFEGDPLTYAVATGPGQGAISYDTAGNFTYVPGTQIAATGGTDSFTFTIDDTVGTGVRHGLLRQLAPTTATVTVTVTQVSPPPGNQAPINGLATVGAPGAGGVVTGSVSATDPDNDPLSYTGTASPAKGAVAVSGDGTFTYTPTADARHDAAADGAPAGLKQDGFTVTASDGKGGTLAVTVSVAVSPRNQAPARVTVNANTPNPTTGVVTGTITATDADADTLTYTVSQNPGRAQQLTLNSATGAFTYTPTAAARLEAGSGGPTSDAFTVTITDGHGGTAAADVSVAVAVAQPPTPGNQAPVAGVATVGTPNPTTGLVTGTVTATDADNDTLTFTVSQQPSRAQQLSLNSATGEFTYTPTAAARLAAGSGGPTSDTFTVTITDGQGGAATADVSVPVSAKVVALPGNSTAVGAIVETPDGSLVQASYDADANKSYLTVIDADGKPRSSAALPGNTVGDPLAGPGGKVYQQTFDDDAQETYLNVVAPDGTTTSAFVPGEVTGKIVVDPLTGKAFLTSTVTPPAQVQSFSSFAAASVFAGPRAAASARVQPAAASPEPGAVTYVTAVAPDGSVTTLGPITGAAIGDLVVGSDGTAYQTTHISDPPNEIYQTYVTAIRSDGSFTTTEPIEGLAQGQLFIGSNGSAYQPGVSVDFATGIYQSFMTVVDQNGATRRLFDVPGLSYTDFATAVVDGNDGRKYYVTWDNSEVTDQTFVTAIDPDGTFRISPPIPGAPNGAPAVVSDGTVYQTTQTSGEVTAYVTTIAPGGQATTRALPGLLSDFLVPGAVGVQLGPDDVAYQFSEDFNTGSSYVTVLGPAGSVVDSTAIPGLPNDTDVHFDSAGTAYLITDALDGGVHQTYVTAIDTDATIRVSSPLPGSPVDGSTLFGPDGAVHVTTSDGQQTYVTVIGADRVVHTALITGEAYPAVGVSPDGVAYQTTVDYDTGKSYVTAVGSDGTTRTSLALNGLPTNNALVVAPSGVVYLTTSAYDATADAYQTYVAAIFADGSVRTSDPITGDVTIRPDGTVYQAGSAGLVVLDPGSWTLHRPPVAATPPSTVVSTDPADGTVAGLVQVTDPDGDTLTYALDPESTAAVVLDPATGGWVYTPTPAERGAAYWGTGPGTTDFTILASDGEFQTAVTVSAPISPVRGTAIVLPTGAVPYGQVVIGSNGTAYQVSYNEATDQTYLTIIGADGVAHTSGPLPGLEISAALGSESQGYIPRSGGGADVFTYQIDGQELLAYVNVIESDGATTTTSVPVPQGLSGLGTVAAPDGAAYLLSYSDYETRVTVVDADGVPHNSDPIPGQAGPAVNQVTFGRDGTAYLTTFGLSADPDAEPDTYQTWVTVIGTDGTTHTSEALPGFAQWHVAFGSDATAYQSTASVIDGSFSNTTYVTIINTDGTTGASAELPGQFFDYPIAAPNGNLYHVTYDDTADETYISTVDSTGTVSQVGQFAGRPADLSVIGADGTLYQPIVTGDSNDPGAQTSVVVVRSDGTVTNSAVPGIASYDGVQIDPAGRAVLITATYYNTETYISAIDSDGTVHPVGTLPGQPTLYDTHHVTPGGAVYQTTTADQTYVTVIGTDGIAHTTPIPGTSVYGIVVAADGSVYQTTLDSAASLTYVTVISPDGTVHTGNAIRGGPRYPGLVVATGGDVYLTTFRAGVTYVGAVDSVGNIRTGDPLTGEPFEGGVVVGPDGTVYQTTSTATSILDPSVWVVQGTGGIGGNGSPGGNGGNGGAGGDGGAGNGI